MTGGRSSEGQVGGAKRNTLLDYIITIDIDTEYNVTSCIVLIMYAIVIDPKINAS